MKNLKLFEEFIGRMSEEDHKYMRAKMRELADLVNDTLSEGYSSDAKFDYEFNGGELEVTLVMDDEHKMEGDFGSFKVLEILFDSETMMVGTYMGHEEDFRVSSVEEALDIIEKKIYDVLGISEKKKN